MRGENRVRLEERDMVSVPGQRPCSSIDFVLQESKGGDPLNYYLEKGLEMG